MEYPPVTCSEAVSSIPSTDKNEKDGKKEKKKERKKEKERKKDAFLTLPISPVSQPIFAFEQTDPTSGMSEQLIWTCLPQGFKNAPTLFDEALARDLMSFREDYPNVMLLQYVDDILVVTDSYENCTITTQALLRTLDELGYKISAKKAQSCQKQVTYLGYQIHKGKWTLCPQRI